MVDQAIAIPFVDRRYACVHPYNGIHHAKGSSADLSKQSTRSARPFRMIATPQRSTAGAWRTRTGRLARHYRVVWHSTPIIASQLCAAGYAVPM